MKTLNGWPLTPARTFTAADGGTITYRDRSGPSDSSPTVLLLHGLGATSGLQFMPTLSQLADDFRVLALDMRRRRGRSSGLLNSVADDATALLDHVGVDHGVVLGYSVGGLVARHLAATAAPRVCALVLAATADPPRVPLLRWPVGLGAAGASRLPGVLPAGSDESRLRFALGELGRLSPAVLLGAVEHAITEPAPPLADLPQPVVFVVTTRDRLVRASWQRRLAATRPDAPVLEVDAGHAASGLEPEVFGPVALRACQLASQLQASR